MNFTKIRRTIALVLWALVLGATFWIGLAVKQIGSRDSEDWIHAFVLTQTVLLAACSVYGPGKLIVRTPLVCAWGLALGFVMATNNLITLPGRSSIAAGAILVGAGALSPLIVFGLHRWRTGGYLVFGNALSRRGSGRSISQLTLQMLMILTAAFAVAAVVARSALTSPTDPFGTEYEILVIHAWLGFFPCLGAAPVLLFIFRPSWKIVLGCGFFILVTLADPLLYALAAPFALNIGPVSPMTTWAIFHQVARDSFLWHGQTAIAVVVYALLARAAGFRMIVPSQSNDKNPNPSAQPSTDAG